MFPDLQEIMFLLSPVYMKTSFEVVNLNSDEVLIRYVTPWRRTHWLNRNQDDQGTGWVRQEIIVDLCMDSECEVPVTKLNDSELHYLGCKSKDRSSIPEQWWETVLKPSMEADFREALELAYVAKHKRTGDETLTLEEWKEMRWKCLPTRGAMVRFIVEEL